MSEQEQAAPRDEALEQETQNGDVTEPLVSPEAEAAGEPEAADEVATRIARIEQERDEYLDQWRRSAAEFQNFKKREERLRLEREKSANARLLKKLLPVLDDLQRAGQHIPEQISDNDWVNGMLAIERKLWGVLEQEGVSPIQAEPGSEFDPNLHEAIVAQPAEEHESGQIVQEYERGYRHNENVLRPARVSVAQ